VGLIDMLAMRRLSEDVYKALPEGSGLLFGGCSLALALTAAAKTVGISLVPRSLHAGFLRPGQWGSEIALKVDRWSDDPSFATRQVTLSQGDRAIARVAASFYLPGQGEDWQDSPSPDVPEPEVLIPAVVRLPQDMIEVRQANGASGLSLIESPHPYWARPIGLMNVDTVVQHAAVAFISDYLVVLSMHKAELPATTTIRTVTHSIWFHREVDVGTWLLFGCDPLSVAQGRGFATGSIYSKKSALVATFAQEVIVQP
jgi:acyl-CoA thioesterase II